MVVQEEMQDRVRHLLKEALPMLCKSGLAFASEFSVDALIGITLNKGDVFLVSIKETIKSDNVEEHSMPSEKDGTKSSSQEDVSPNHRRKPHRKRRRSKASKHSDSENSSLSNDESEDISAIKREKREDEERTNMNNHIASVQDHPNFNQTSSNSHMNYSSPNTDNAKRSPEEMDNESNDAIIVKEEPADYSNMSFSDMSANEHAFNMSTFSQHGIPMAPHMGAPSSISSQLSQSLPIPGPSSYGQPVQMVRNLNTSVPGQGGPGVDGQAPAAPGAMVETVIPTPCPVPIPPITEENIEMATYKTADSVWCCLFCLATYKRQSILHKHVRTEHMKNIATKLTKQPKRMLSEEAKMKARERSRDFWRKKRNDEEYRRKRALQHKEYRKKKGKPQMTEDQIKEKRLRDRINTKRYYEKKKALKVKVKEEVLSTSEAMHEIQSKEEHQT